jgi:bacterioferritin
VLAKRYALRYPTSVVFPQNLEVAVSVQEITNKQPVLECLDKILEAELSGVVRYLHYSFMIFGANRIPITKWFRDHAQEGIQHATLIGEKITALGGHPTLKVRPVPESNQHNVMSILKESLEYEQMALNLYYELLALADGNVPLEEMTRTLIREETEHIEEVEKMVRTVN